ncbi:MAG TPA: hypothetical protein VIP11_23790, partial [Gemmatimonadaceae bacterium]
MTARRIAAAFALALPLPLTVAAQTKSAIASPAPSSSSSSIRATKAASNNIEAFMGPSSPLEIATAKKKDKVAWVAYERGMRNVYVASAPDFKPIKITKFNDDN